VKHNTSIIRDTCYSLCITAIPSASLVQRKYKYTLTIKHVGWITVPWKIMKRINAKG
jgi:hypothetical protein